MNFLCKSSRRRCVHSQSGECVFQPLDIESSHVAHYNTCEIPEKLGPVEKRASVFRSLKNNGYKDDEGVANEPGFEGTDLMSFASSSKEMGDIAFEQEDFREAIGSYTKFIDARVRSSPTVYARRGMSYVMKGMPQEALSDAKQAVDLSKLRPVAHIASNVRSVALDNIDPCSFCRFRFR